MYCPQCVENWNYVPGKRYFRSRPAHERGREAEMLCPSCAESPADKQLRQTRNMGDDIPQASLRRTEHGCRCTRVLMVRKNSIELLRKQLRRERRWNQRQLTNRADAARFRQMVERLDEVAHDSQH